MAKANPAGGSGADEGRDSWCTPKWLAELLGRFDLDPCSNPRSHISAAVHLTLEGGDNGLAEAHGQRGYSQHTDDAWGIDRSAIASVQTRVFINPPYARKQVIRWVRHWRTTRFVFLLRWDPSTEWFAELIPHCTHVWFPPRRINFEPPPGVKASSNPFPHALYLRNPPQDLLDRLAAAGYLMPIDQELLDFYIAGDDADDNEGHANSDDGSGDEGEAAEGGARDSGERAEAVGYGVWGIADWIPRSKPIDFSKIDKIQDDIDDKFIDWKLKREEENIARAKANGGCGECVDCKYGLGWCVYKTEQYRRDF